MDLIELTQATSWQSQGNEWGGKLGGSGSGFVLLTDVCPSIPLSRTQFSHLQNGIDWMISRVPSNAEDALILSGLASTPCQQFICDWHPAFSPPCWVFGSLESVMMGTMAKAFSE